MRRATEKGSDRNERTFQPARAFRTQDDRDAYLESTYTYDRREFGEVYSTLLLVSDRREEFAAEFLRRFSHGAFVGTSCEAFGDWQEQRFGRELEPAAFAILWSLVNMSVISGRSFESKRKRARPFWRTNEEMALWCACVHDNPRHEGEGTEDWLTRIAVYAGALRGEELRAEAV